MTTCSLTEVGAYQKLKNLAVKPYDLVLHGLSEARMEKFVASGAGLDLLYGCQRIDEEVMGALQELADQLDLVTQFKEMRRGKVINRIDGYPSEERQVLHCACRDIDSEHPAEPAATEQAKVELERLRSFLGELESGNLVNEEGKPFDTLIHIGIGGSDLGPRMVYEGLRAYSVSGRRVFFIANVDPDDAAAVLRRASLKTSLVVVGSKSGTTLETLSNEELVRCAFQAEGLDPARRFLAVTGKESPMDNPERYLRSFYMYDYIGGRFSISSMVGAVTLAFALGIEHVTDFLRGAATVDRMAEKSSIASNLPLLMALLGLWNRNFLGYSTVAVLPYSQPLHRFSAHLQQCDMESNGKSVDRSGNPVKTETGPIVWGEPGTNGQHAFYQLLHQGSEIVPVEFIGFRESQYGEDVVVDGTSSQQKLVANMLAQGQAMAQGDANDNPNRVFGGNRPSLTLVADRLTPEIMGQLLALYEAKIVFQGFSWNINSFDQEGVQLGKRLAGGLLELMQGKIGSEKAAGEFLLKVAGVAQNEAK
ncbi:MAG: glucose-6-phosphate isomerase [Thermodesulfobacteriota bacterium]